MKTRKNFKAQTLSKREMRELNGGGWIGTLVGIGIAVSVIATLDGVLDVLTGKYVCPCAEENNNG